MYKISENNKFYITRGDSAKDINLGIVDADGNAYTPKGDETILFTVKSSTSTEVHLIQKSIVDSKFSIDPVDTESLAYGDYLYDVQLKMADGYTDTIIRPTLFRVLEEVTF